MIANFKKATMALVIAILALAAMPVYGVFAAGQADPPDPPAEGIQGNVRLEKIWARELKAYERLGKFFDHSEGLIDKVQGLIDRAAANGKDVSALQAALDTFEEAVKDAHPIYESAKGIINSHQGFDANGNVTDPGKAKQTVRDMADKLKEIKQALGGTGKDLRDAMKAFREANRPPDEQD